jgi:hypothetical protein
MAWLSLSKPSTITSYSHGPRPDVALAPPEISPLCCLSLLARSFVFPTYFLFPDRITYTWYICLPYTANIVRNLQ